MPPTNRKKCSPILAAAALTLAELTMQVGSPLAAGALPESVIAKSDSVFTEAEKKQIGELAGTAKGLSETDPAAISKARGVLLAPLRGEKVGLGFRVEYAQWLVPVLRPLVADKRDEVAINAVRVAGELATRNSAELLTEAMKDPREGIRVAAAMGYRRIFSTLQGGQQTLSAQQATAVVNEIGAALGKDPSASVAESLVVALEAAVAVPETIVPDLRLTALDQISDRVGARAREPHSGPEFIPAVLRAGRAARTVLVAVNSKAPSPATLVKVGGLAGDSVAMVRNLLSGGAELSEAERGDLATLAAQAEGIYGLAHTQLGGSPVALKLESLLDGTKDEQFKAAAAKLIGPDSALTKPPFALPMARFEGK